MGIGFVHALPLAALMAVTLAPPAMADVINGTEGPDELVGTAQADTIRGFGGNDILRGRRGGDRLYGGPGADQLYPGLDSKGDVLYGGAGPDRIRARDRDTVYAGRGNDTIRVSGVGITVWCGPGEDRVINAEAFIKLRGCEIVD